VLANKVSDLEKTQLWMKYLIGLLGVVGVVLLGFTVFFAQEGVKSYLSKTGNVQQISPAK
jgi:hypothetical protein